MNIFDFKIKKSRGEKISMVTCYDYTSARIVAESDVDVVLVGDSLAMTIYGYDTTLPATVPMMALHTAAVVRGLQHSKSKKFIVGDMPFLSFRKSPSENMAAVEAIMQAGAHSVKLEGVAGNEDLIKHLVQSGVPIMGHLGLTPQSVHGLGGFKVQGRDANSRELILEAAKKLEDLGAFSVVLECVPSALAREVTSHVSIPTIGIGAGPDTDGQVLVMQDLLGLNSDFRPKFVREYLTGKSMYLSAFNQFAADVKSGKFPSTQESFE